ncbi:hypothetical protein U6A24_10865 [Aquimarina gracilis]|uniref:Uncharacterized protein n=1 Tax=Aquimarina gracilis TaxID=874422 RepID=A0ABU5ZVR3_9FLAO|nr:hypothetical protein [Aquimarina gracilis]MEB3345965.1 hypothetical protein [Aquimarina gracilis]
MLLDQYPQLSFDNHCYLRIGLDNLVKAKWDTLISRSPYKHSSEGQRDELIKLLMS